MLMVDVDGCEMLESLNKLFTVYKGEAPLSIVPLEQSGSDRQYFRLSSHDWTCIGTLVPDSAEGECFVRLADDFEKAGCPVPQVYVVSSDYHCYLQEDLGSASLFSVLGSPEAAFMVKETLRRLVSLQKAPEHLWKKDCMNRDFSLRQVMWDLNYFKYEFLKPSNLLFDEDLLEDDFQLLAQRLLSIKKEYWGFMMRDCQSRNVMMTEGGPVFIDFQGGRFGPALYDVVSFLWQARAAFSAEFRMEMLDYYTDIYCNGLTCKKADMTDSLYDMVLFRTLQVLGAYGFRGLVQRKAHFLLSIPPALRNLDELLRLGILDSYPELKKVAEGLVSEPKFQPAEKAGTLTVEIYSFSYKKGYPENLTGNGGGFMFDCRAMKNPGRFKEYRKLTGRDKEVVDFLERCGEVGHFLKAAWALTDPAIERYLSRGFDHLQIGFGCTGGQHRSVYCAEHTAEHIRTLFPDANVILIHREHPSPQIPEPINSLPLRGGLGRGSGAKAMLLCAGLGTRLKPWTEHHPKALVPVGGVPMLKRVIVKLADQGFDEVTINVHHFADQILSYIEEEDMPVSKINVSDETGMLLDTGGGLLNAEKYLAKDGRPFLVHNVDILSNANLRQLYDAHIASGNNVTLLVSDRVSDRKLVFDSDMKLKGWINLKTEETRPSGLEINESDSVLAFSGIYVMSPEVFRIMKNHGLSGKFPIMDFFLAGYEEAEIGGLRQDKLDIIDIGKPDTLHRANLSIQ